MMRRAAVALASVGVLACEGPSVGGTTLDGGPVVLGVLQFEPEVDLESGALLSCPWSGRVLALPILIDTLLWPEFDLPLLVQNGGPASSEGTRRFDETITPSGVARVHWNCFHPPSLPSAQPYGSAELVDGGVYTPDGGPEDLPDTLYLPSSSSDDLPLPYLVLHHRDLSRPFCKADYLDDENVSSQSALRLAASGERILGGDQGMVTLRAVSRELVLDIDYELQLGELAVACCAEASQPRCTRPLVGPSCDRLRAEFRTLTATATTADRGGLVEPFEPLIQELASRPRVLWTRLNLRLEFHDPYGARLEAPGWVRVGFCRGCGGRWPLTEEPTPSPVMECLARKPWESG